MAEKDEPEQHFFDFAAEAGLTKHYGGLRATDELAELCHIGEGSHVLDVGCGAGQTASYLAMKYGCKVMGVDVVERMVERSREMARAEGVADRTEFRVADAQSLPFGDGAFDAVITESVTVFPEDKERAAREYARVTMAGGYVGLSESTWLKTPVPQEILAWAAQDLGSHVKPLTEEGWVGLLEAAGLTGIVARTYQVQVRDEAKALVGRYGYGGMLRSLWRVLVMYTKNPEYRKFVKGVRGAGVVPGNLVEYMGYGIYVGRKQP